MKKCMSKTICAFISVVLIVMVSVQNATADPLSLPVEGTVLGVEETPIVGALVTLTNIDTTEIMTEYTDANGDWEFDLGDLSGGWTDGDVIEIKVDYLNQMIYATRMEVDEDMEKLDFTRAGIMGNPRLPLDYMNRDGLTFTTDNFFPGAVIIDRTSPYKFDTEMRYRDEMVGYFDDEDYDLKAYIHAKFWTAETNPGFWIPKSYESPTKDYEYNFGPYDTNEVVHSATVTPPQGVVRWYCQFQMWGNGLTQGGGSSWAFLQWVNSGNAVWETIKP